MKSCEDFTYENYLNKSPSERRKLEIRARKLAELDGRNWDVEFDDFDKVKYRLVAWASQESL